MYSFPVEEYIITYEHLNIDTIIMYVLLTNKSERDVKHKPLACDQNKLILVNTHLF